MTVSIKTVEENVRLLVSLGEYAEAAEMASANIPRGEMHDDPRRQAFKNIAHATLVDGAYPAALELLGTYGNELDDDTIVSIVERVAADAPNLADGLRAILASHEADPTVPLPGRSKPVVIDDLPAAARQFDDE